MGRERENMGPVDELPQAPFGLMHELGIARRNHLVHNEDVRLDGCGNRKDFSRQGEPLRGVCLRDRGFLRRKIHPSSERSSYSPASSPELRSS
jgi:hypothetical protein